MCPRPSRRLVFVAMLALSVLSWVGCNKTSTNSVSAASDGGKLPITTKSEEAKKEFLQGRDLSERLLAQDSLQHFDKALSLDPEFASAELARANNSPTAKEFFEHLRKAAGLLSKTSDGEKLLILANEAAANGVNEIQKNYLDQLVTTYPNDERAHLQVGNYYFGQQQYEQAITHYKQATHLAPSFSPAYNILGYAYRQQGNYGEAEQAFKKYVELIPNDPNPYDSYAELLLKMGRFDDSIAQYRKALSIDPHFVPSHFGISADLMYQGKPQEATAELQAMADQARNDGEMRTAHFGMAVVAADTGKFDNAVQHIEKEYAIAEKKNDVAAMAADLQAKGNILEAAGKYDAAAEQFERSLQLIEGSNLSQDIKDNAKRTHQFNLAALAIGKKDYSAAKSHTDEFRQSAETAKNSAQLKQAHELTGRLALAQKQYDTAISELEQSNQQDPRNLYRLGQAYQAKSNSAKAQEYFEKAAEFNSLPALNYAFIRQKAQKVAGGQKG